MSSTKRRVLVLFAHPALQKSRVNRRLIQEPQGLAGVHVHDLYEEYPRLEIDVRREQRLLADHDVVVFQHPFYWYSAPSIMKEWQDLVLEHGWAYGSEGRALHGKRWLQVTSTGGPEEAYCSQGQNHATVRQLLAPMEQTARLCGMRFLPPFVVYGAHALDESGIEAAAADYRALLVALRDDQVDEAAVDSLPCLTGELIAGLPTDTEG